jgi:hypothetical protein
VIILILNEKYIGVSLGISDIFGNIHPKSTFVCNLFIPCTFGTSIAPEKSYEEIKAIFRIVKIQENNVLNLQSLLSKYNPIVH